MLFPVWDDIELKLSPTEAVAGRRRRADRMSAFAFTAVSLRAISKAMLGHLTYVFSRKPCGLSKRFLSCVS